MTTEPIDWKKPICLDTVPPRMAASLGLSESGSGNYDVLADWAGRGALIALYVYPDGRAIAPVSGWAVRVRNVRPGDFEPTAPAADLARELAEALRRVEVMLRGNWTATDVADAHRIATAILAKWEASK